MIGRILASPWHALCGARSTLSNASFSTAAAAEATRVGAMLSVGAASLVWSLFSLLPACSRLDWHGCDGTVHVWAFSRRGVPNYCVQPHREQDRAAC